MLKMQHITKQAGLFEQSYLCDQVVQKTIIVSYARFLLKSMCNLQHYYVQIAVASCPFLSCKLELPHDLLTLGEHENANKKVKINTCRQGKIPVSTSTIRKWVIYQCSVKGKGYPAPKFWYLTPQLQLYKANSLHRKEALDCHIHSKVATLVAVAAVAVVAHAITGVLNNFPLIKMVAHCHFRELQGKQMLHPEQNQKPLHLWNPAAHCATGMILCSNIESIFSTLHLQRRGATS